REPRPALGARRRGGRRRRPRAGGRHPVDSQPRALRRASGRGLQPRGGASEVPPGPDERGRQASRRGTVVKIEEVIRAPILTEKSELARDATGAYTFEVDRRATKDDIKAAIKRFFGVDPVEVRTQIVRGKT